MTDKRKTARPCPLCWEDQEAFGVVGLYTEAGWLVHCRDYHPDLTPDSIAALPLPWSRRKREVRA